MQSVIQYWETGESAVLSLPPWQALLLLVGGSLVVAWLVRVGGDVVVRRVTRRIDGDVDDVVFETLHPPIYISVVLLGVFAAVRALGLAPGMTATLRAGVVSVLVVLWAVTLTRLGRRVSRAASDTKAVDKGILPIFQNVWSALVIGVSVFLLLSLWEVDVTPLLASAGIVGIVVGFAARDTIANFFGSIALYADGTYSVGDFIVLDSGERGRVEDISIRSTVIRTRDDVLVTVPNSVLNESTIVNESAPRTKRRVRIPVGVDYESDLEAVETALLDVAANQDLVLDRPKPRVRFRGFGDSAVDVQLMCWIPAPVHRGRATHELVKDVHAAFREADIGIPFPQRELSFKQVTPDGVPVGPTGESGGNEVAGGAGD